MNQEKAESYVGKQVYTVAYGEMQIIEHLVEKVQCSTYQSGDMYALINCTGSVIFNPKDTWEKAHESLTQYYETRLNVAMDNLNSVQRMKDLHNLEEK